MSKLTYRSEIDGLRAIAVAAVIVFHINPLWLEGGFLGVDVFFVISGYLITAIIQKGIDQGDFSLKSFWLRRIRRLYPALFAMLACVIVAANFILINPERTDLFGQTIASVFSFSNIFLYFTTGNYWSNSSESIALLHTWSLSLEEQFYIIFPPLLAIVHRYSRKALLPAIATIGIVSLGISIVQTPVDQSAAFYLLPSRMWELLVGSLIAVIGARGKLPVLSKGISTIATFAGIGLVLISFATIGYNDAFPGYRPIFPCLGTALVLIFGANDLIGKKILGCPPVNYTGRISYSLYLWHWPIIVLSRFLSPEPNTVLLILSTFAIAAISYHCVENPFRYGLKTKSKLVFATPIAILALALPLRIVHGSPGLPPALKELEEGYRHNVPLESNASSTILATGKGVCLSDPTDQIDILLIGDSHADALARTLGLYAVDKGLSFENLAATGVSITDDQPKLKRLFAGELNEARIKRIKGVKARVGILADAWIWDVNRPNFQAQLNKHLAALSESCETVYVLSQVPMVSLPKTHEKALNKYALALFRSGLEDVGFTEFARISEINTEVKSAVEKLNFRNVEFVDIYPSLIDPNGGVKVISDGKLYYHDYYHIGDRGGQLVMDSGLASRIEQALAPRIAQGLTQ